MLGAVILFIVSCFAHAEVACQKTCGGSGLVVDLQAQCMCLGNGGECFKVDIGIDGPHMTAIGKGKTHDAAGAKYKTTNGPGTMNYDKDAIATGIPANDSPGKWIHKTRNCGQGGQRATKGCIGVPCDVWPLVKKKKGENIEICVSDKYSKEYSRKYDGTSHMTGAPNSAETNEDDPPKQQKGRGAR